MDPEDSMKTERSIHLQVFELRKLSETYSSSPTIFEPQSTMEKRDSTNTIPAPSPGRLPPHAPEKSLTLFALRLAILEKAATGLGTLGFIWATVVLLGGFAITLSKTDFWFITIILLIEGTRIFSRSHELEWQHQATWSLTDAGVTSFRAIRAGPSFLLQTVRSKLRRLSEIEIAGNGNEESRMWVNSNVPLLPHDQWIFMSRNMSKLLYWLQLASAAACAVLSLMKLIRHDYGDVAKGESDKRNRKSALNIFYALALAEALLFLLEKAYWEWKVTYGKLLEEVNRECRLGESGMISIRRFFYDSYSRCVNGSIFDGLNMDMISFAMDLLASNSPDEQLIGVQILRKFSASEPYSDDTLQKIGVSLSVIERLVEMLNWKDPQEEQIRQSAAEILSKLAGKKQNSLRVAGIPGAMESISSLLHTSRGSVSAADEITDKKLVSDEANYDFYAFNHLGLTILKKLARDHDNCGKIGNTRGLLPKIIDFTHIQERLLKDEHATASQILTVKRSLQVVKMLASTTGTTGKLLRREISEIVFTVSNIRDILRHGEQHPMLQKLGIEILTSLALEEEATESIGGTGGILKELFIIFFKKEMPDGANHARTAAGDALAMLALESKNNCHRILKQSVTEKLVRALEVPLLRVNAARIIRNLCIYSGADCFHQLKTITIAAPTVLKAIMLEENKLQEVMIGLATELLKLMTSDESRIMFEKAGICKVELAYALVQILKKYHHPPMKIPRIRRFAIELTIWMMKDEQTNVQVFRSLGMERELEGVMETVSEMESFNIFSGTVGLSRHSTAMHTLVETALKFLGDEEDSATGTY